MTKKVGGVETTLSSLFTDETLRSAGVTSNLKDLVDAGVLRREGIGFAVNPLPANTPEAPKTPPPPAPKAAPAPPQPTPEKAPVPAPTPAPSLGGPAWMKIGGEVDFLNENRGKMERGTITDIVYSGDPPNPVSVTVKRRDGKTMDIDATMVHEPQGQARRREYYEALAGLSSEERKDVQGKSRVFDDLLIKNAELFVEPGYIDEVFQKATTDRQRAKATYEVLNMARGESGNRLGIENPHNPIQRAENLQRLKDLIESERPGGSQAETQDVVAGLLPMGKRTVRKEGHWWNVSYNEETGKIVLKDGREISVDPDEPVTVEEIRSPKEQPPKAVTPGEQPPKALPPEKPAAPPKEEAAPKPAPEEKPAPPAAPAPEEKPSPPPPAPEPEKPAAPPEAPKPEEKAEVPSEFKVGDKVEFEKKGLTRMRGTVEKVVPGYYKVRGVNG